jgi:hypothetical protein
MRSDAKALTARLASMGDGRYSVDDSKSVRSVWVWRGFVLMALVAVGFVIILAANGYTTYAALWGVIALGWFSIGMWLWRQHTKLQD